MKDIRDKLAALFLDNTLNEVGDIINQLSDKELSMMMDEYSDAPSDDISKMMSALTALHMGSDPFTGISYLYAMFIAWGLITATQEA